MSDRRWQTGIQLQSPVGGYPSYWHRSIFRYMFEFLTKVVGWADVDSPDADWDSVVASGVDGATHASLPNRFTAASATFSSSDVEQFLTITGMAAPNEERNGIYQIKQVISATEVVVHIKLGVHSDGLPLSLSGLSWRLWRSTNSPAVNAVAVVAGTGRTGAGLTNAVGPIGAASFTFGGGTVTLTDAGATFQTSDVGKSVTIANATTPGNNGTFTIASRVSATQITYANGAGATEAFGGSTTWKIRYKYHVRLQVYNGGMYDPSYLGYFDHSPWETWNAVSHAWNDSRHTGTVTMVFNQPANGTSQGRVWACGDPDSATFWFVTEHDTGDGWVRSMLLIHFGEIDTFYPALDPRPVVNAYGYQRYPYEFGTVGTSWGWTSPVGANIRMMSWDEVTALVAYLMFPHTAYSSDQHWLASSRRRQSEYSKKLYRMPLIVESRTAGHMELRGTMRHLQYIPQSQPTTFQAIGAAHDWIHMNSGIIMPWHAGKQWYEYTGRSGGGYAV